jgi:hypothetical protein
MAGYAIIPQLALVQYQPENFQCSGIPMMAPPEGNIERVIRRSSMARCPEDACFNRKAASSSK